MNDWILVSKRRPPFDQSVIVWAKSYVRPCEAAIDKSGRFYSPDSGCDVTPRPTHWVAFPSPPNGEAK